MAVLRVDHPDILQFIRAKRNSDQLTGFNISVGVTDEFMEHLESGTPFPLRFEGRTYEVVNPQDLWDEIMRSNWDWAEPGVLFIDTINKYNNLWYLESIEATNPCGEQPLPPNGACLLGSWNLVKYLTPRIDGEGLGLDYGQLADDIPHIVRAMDNVIDRTSYPLKAQEIEAKQKRRMGLGITGLANTLEAMGYAYGTPEFLAVEEEILSFLAHETYAASIELAKEKGEFPLLDRDRYVQSLFMRRMDESIREQILEHGIRNSHLLSIAPTGTISLTADNVSSAIEPPYTLAYQRTIQTFDGPVVESVEDYGYRFLKVAGLTADEVSAQAHVDVLCVAQSWIDSAVSKTCNVGDHVTYDEFKELYRLGWLNGAKGMTTFRKAGKRFGIFSASPKEPDETPSAEACTFDPLTGEKTCDS